MGLLRYIVLCLYLLPASPEAGRALCVPKAPELLGNLPSRGGSVKERRRRFLKFVDRNLYNFGKKFQSMESLSSEKRASAMRARFLPGPRRRFKALLKAGLTPGEIQALEEEGVFALDALEHRRMATLLPLGRSHVRPGVLASRLGPNGILEHILVRRVRGGSAWVSLPADSKAQVVGMERVALGTLYRPLELHKEILYISEKSPLPQRFSVAGVGDEGTALLSPMDGRGGQKKASLRQLALRPRDWTDVTTEDLSRPLNREEARDLRESFLALERLYGEEGESENFVAQNNELIERLQFLMRRQGISSTPSPSPEVSGALELVINGVLPEGNLIMRRLVRLLEGQGYLWFSVSLVQNIRAQSKGFADKTTMRLNLGPDPLLDILAKRDGEVLLRHVAHLKVESRRRAGRESLLDYSLSRALTPASFHDDPEALPEETFPLSELYAMVLELRGVAGRIPPEEGIDGLIASAWGEEFAAYLIDLGAVARNIKQFLESFEGNETFSFRVSQGHFEGHNFYLLAQGQKVEVAISERSLGRVRHDLKAGVSPREQERRMGGHMERFIRKMEEDLKKLHTLSGAILSQAEKVETALVDEGRPGLEREVRRLVLLVRKASLTSRELF